ncbi:helix-turn-helix domain-containing protein [Micromonospora sp. NPDC007230]|uniref:helix-turn-helix domain-containing protein n=1 Tax=Micromonospora sp. NPDC007230 TaxID=3364237 RepID=UPI00368BABF6
MDDHTVTGRVLAILEVLAEAPSGQPVGLAQLTARTSIPKPTVRRIANDLVAKRLVLRNGGGYLLGPRMMTLGTHAERQLGAVELVTPFVHELHARSGSIAWAGLSEGLHIDLIDSAHGREHAAIMASSWPRQLDFPHVPSTAIGHLVAARHPQAVEEVVRRGISRLTKHTVVVPGRYAAKVRRAAETRSALEWEECRLGWWCAAVEIQFASQCLILGMTGRTSGTVPARILSDLYRLRDELAREIVSNTRRDL